MQREGAWNTGHFKYLYTWASTFYYSTHVGTNNVTFFIISWTSVWLCIWQSVAPTSAIDVSTAQISVYLCIFKLSLCSVNITWHAWHTYTTHEHKLHFQHKWQACYSPGFKMTEYTLITRWATHSITSRRLELIEISSELIGVMHPK